MSVATLSSSRSALAGLENAYSVAIQIRETTGVDQFVVRTNNPIQPYRVTRTAPTSPEVLLALVA